MTKLTHFEVQGPFGLFDHNVALRTKQRITIIHAPNGFGKTAILKMIAGFFGGSLLVFRQYEFKVARFLFADGTSVRILQSFVESEDKRRPGERQYELVLEGDGEQLERWSPWDAPEIEEERRLVENRLNFRDDDYIRERWLRDSVAGRRISPAEAFERYEHLYPRGHRASMPPKLKAIRNLFECRLIDTQRLMIRSEKGAKQEGKTDFIPAVLTYSQEVSASIKNAIQQSAAITQLLDQSFPNRLLARGKGSFTSLGEPQLRARLTVSGVVQEVFDHTQRNIGLEDATAFINNFDTSAIDIRELVCGHDLSAALGIALQSLIGSRPAAYCVASELEAKLRMSFSREDFAQTSTYAAIQSWQQRNHPFRCLH